MKIGVRALLFEVGFLTLWILSIAASTFIGFDRGRWAEGIVLGVSLGPIGAIATGLLPPSHEWEGRRRYLLNEEIAKHRKLAAEYAKQREEEVRRMRELVSSLAESIQSQQHEPSDGLDELAANLRNVIRDLPQTESRLRPSIEWLEARAQRVREEGERATA
jgi:hypothetical protein